MASFSEYLKNIFWVLLLLQFAPLLITGIKTHYSELFEEKTKVGVITFKGAIVAVSPFIRDIKNIFENKAIKAVVLRVNSPGGDSAATQSIFNEILHYKKLHPEKYVVTLVDQIAASGGYYIASAGDHIVASPSALIGSIGAYMQFYNVSELIKNLNITYEITKAGEFKGGGNPLLPLTTEQKAQFQDLTNDVYRQFKRDISQRRPTLPSEAKKWAEGKVFTGEQALAINLIDSIGSPSTVEKVLRDKAQIVGKIEWIKASKKQSFLKNLLDPEEEQDSSYLESAVHAICAAFEKRYSSSLRMTCL